jgi:hypothetical protein
MFMPLRHGFIGPLSWKIHSECFGKSRVDSEGFLIKAARAAIVAHRTLICRGVEFYFYRADLADAV